MQQPLQKLSKEIAKNKFWIKVLWIASVIGVFATTRLFILYLIDDVSFEFPVLFVVTLLITVLVWITSQKLSDEILKEQQLEYLAITTPEACLKQIEWDKGLELSEQGRECHAIIVSILADANYKLDEDFFISNMTENKIILSQSVFNWFTQKIANESLYRKMLLESYVQVSTQLADC